LNVGILNDHLEYFVAIWYNLWPFSIVCGHLLYSSQSVMIRPRKMWQPCSQCVEISPVRNWFDRNRGLLLYMQTPNANVFNPS
jgi:hypothetical protein